MQNDHRENTYCLQGKEFILQLFKSFASWMNTVISLPKRKLHWTSYKWMRSLSIYCVTSIKYLYAFLVANLMTLLEIYFNKQFLFIYVTMNNLTVLVKQRTPTYMESFLLNYLQKLPNILAYKLNRNWKRQQKLLQVLESKKILG